MGHEPRNLLAPVDPFQTKSRAILIEQVAEEMFAGCSMLTIRGCRGVGKTHVGRHLAWLLREQDCLVICVSGAVHGIAHIQGVLAQARSELPLCSTDVGRGTDRLVLLVDDAQACPAVLFSYLWSLVARRYAGEPTIQLLLLGDVGPWPGLDDPGLENLRQASTSCYILVPFEEHEAAAYIRHRLAQAGWKPCRLGNRAALRDMIGYSQGVPARLDSFVSKALVLHAQALRDQAAEKKRLLFREEAKS